MSQSKQTGTKPPNAVPGNSGGADLKGKRQSVMTDVGEKDIEQSVDELLDELEGRDKPKNKDQQDDEDHLVGFLEKNPKAIKEAIEVTKDKARRNTVTNAEIANIVKVIDRNPKALGQAIQRHKTLKSQKANEASKVTRKNSLDEVDDLDNTANGSYENINVSKQNLLVGSKDVTIRDESTKGVSKM